MLELAQTDKVCSARCPHCGAVNIFPGGSAIEAFRSFVASAEKAYTCRERWSELDLASTGKSR